MSDNILSRIDAVLNEHERWTDFIGRAVELEIARRQHEHPSAPVPPELELTPGEPIVATLREWSQDKTREQRFEMAARLTEPLIGEPLDKILKCLENRFVVTVCRIYQGGPQYYSDKLRRK